MTLHQDESIQAQPNIAQPSPEAAQAFPSQGKLLALDVGLARIGIAVCDPLRLGARPLFTLPRASRNEDFSQLAAVARREEIVGVVCGLPLNMDGSAGAQAQTTRKWAMRLAHALRTLLGKPVSIALWDERLSSYAARQAAADWPRHVGEDAMAAAVILQSFLDAQRRDAETFLVNAELIVLPPRQTAQGALHD